MKLKYTLILLLITAIIAYPATAAVTVVTAPYTDSENTATWDNLINAEVRVDPENSITEIQVFTVEGNTATIQMQFDNNTIYRGQKTATTWLGFTFHYLSHELIVANTTIFNETFGFPQPNALNLGVTYNSKTTNNSYHIYATPVDLLLYVQTNYVQALPAQTVRIQSDVPFHVYIKYSNGAEISAKEEQVKGMNGLLHLIYNFAYGLGQGDNILPILQMLDTIILIMAIILGALYTYPYLVMIWYITFLNVYVSFKTETFSDFIVKWVSGAWAGIQFGIALIIQIAYTVMSILKLIRQIFQI